MPTDTSDNVGLNFGRFVVTFEAGGIGPITLPPDDRLTVRVFRRGVVAAEP